MLRRLAASKHRKGDLDWGGRCDIKVVIAKHDLGLVKGYLDL